MRGALATVTPGPERERGSPGSIDTGGASSARSVVMGSGLAPSARPGTTTEVISRMSYKDYWWRALRGAPSGPSCRDGDPRCSDILAAGRRALIFVKVVAASMSGSGQTRTFQPRWLMSAIPPERKSWRALVMSQKRQKRTFAKQHSCGDARLAASPGTDTGPRYSRPVSLTAVNNERTGSY
jgi:hypothetical protein